MFAADLIDRLERVRRTTRGWSALCPAHDDSEPSLWVVAGDDGSPVLRCHAGCSRVQITKALAIEERDLFAYRRGKGGVVILGNRRIRLGADVFEYLGDERLRRERDDHILARAEIERWLPRTVYLNFVGGRDDWDDDTLDAFSEGAKEWLLEHLDDLEHNGDGIHRYLGVRRALSQLQAQRPATERALNPSREDLLWQLHRTEEGETVLVGGPPGLGKTFAAMSVARSHGAAIIATKTVEKAREIFAELGPERAQLHLGVLNGECVMSDIAERVQLLGSSVPKVVCARCKLRQDCPARQPNGDGEIIVTTHELLPVVETNGLRFVDEEPTLWVSLTVQYVSDALRFVEAELASAEPVFHRTYLLAMRRWLWALRAGDGRPAREMGLAVWDETAWAQVQGSLSGVAAWLWEVAGGSRDDENILSSISVTSGPKRLQDRALRGLELLRPLRLAAKYARNELFYESHDHRVQAELLTPMAESIKEKGAVVLDATGRAADYLFLREEITELRYDGITDSAPISRLFRYESKASRSRLLPKGARPKRRRLLQWIFETARKHEVTKLLLVTFVGLERRWEQGEDKDLFDAWKAEGRLIEIRHYGELRGLNKYQDFGGIATIGDPRPRIDVVHQRARLIGSDPNEYVRHVTTGELEQVHGRGRDVTRSTRLLHIHIGGMAPMGWHDKDGQTQFVREEVGRPEKDDKQVRIETFNALATGPDMSDTELARQLGVSRSMISHIRSGRKAPSKSVIQRLRGLISASNRDDC